LVQLRRAVRLHRRSRRYAPLRQTRHRAPWGPGMKEVWCVLHSKIELFNDDGSPPTERAMSVDPVIVARCRTHGSRLPCPWCPDGRFPARIADLTAVPPTQEQLEEVGRQILSELPSEPGRGRNRILE